jgi:hypothetical protein
VSSSTAGRTGEQRALATIGGPYPVILRELHGHHPGGLGRRFTGLYGETPQDPVEERE